MRVASSTALLIVLCLWQAQFTILQPLSDCLQVHSSLQCWPCLWDSSSQPAAAELISYAVTANPVFLALADRPEEQRTCYNNERADKEKDGDHVCPICLVKLFHAPVILL